MERKYRTEFALESTAGLTVVLDQHGLNDKKLQELAKKHPFHIYMIHRRPRLRLDPDTFQVTTDRVTGAFTATVGPDAVRLPFDVPNQLGTAAVRLECHYPHTEAKLFNTQSGECVSNVRVGLLAQALGVGGEHLDLEVLYVGQSYGVEGARSAPQRLASHGTLQQIYADAMRNFPDYEIWLTLWHFGSPIIVSMTDGRAEKTLVDDEGDDDHVFRVLASPITEQQQINFTEAALIRYFKPEYNIHYKDTFPNPAHSTYAECYDLDLNAVAVTFTTEDLNLRVWSEAAGRSWLHVAQFELHSREDRKSMFDLFSPEAESR